MPFNYQPPPIQTGSSLLPRICTPACSTMNNWTFDVILHRQFCPKVTENHSASNRPLRSLNTTFFSGRCSLEKNVCERVGLTFLLWLCTALSFTFPSPSLSLPSSSVSYVFPRHSRCGLAWLCSSYTLPLATNVNDQSSVTLLAGSFSI